MGNPTRRQPVPARGEPIPAAIEAIEQTPPAPGNANVSPEQEDAKSVVENATEARALLDFGDYLANDLVIGTADEITAMMLAGNVDPHPDAVAYARSLLA